MSTSIKLRRSSISGKIPTTGQLELGEVAINTHDGKMFFKRDANGALSIVELGIKDVADNVLYVSKNGSDDNSGETIAEAFLTIDAAIAAANTGTTIFVKSGDYTISNPITIPAEVAIVGDNLRTTNIYGANANNDIFYVNNGTYVTGVTFRGHTDGAAAISFDPSGSAGDITTSPYIQNCSSITTTGTGMKIDGSVVTGLRSMVSDAFTQINAGGVGIHLLNQGYAQLVSIFTVACDVGVLAESGGQCSLTNSNCSFGNFGLRSTGVSSVLYSGTTSSSALTFGKQITLSGLSERPKYGDAVKFATDPKYYTVANSTPLSSSSSTITIEETFETNIGSGVAVEFFQRSLIAASSITFEYVGSGTNLYDTPRSGAFPIQENEVVEDTDGRGKVYFTSTDHKGDFRIGGDLVINRESGTITGTTFDRSLFAVLTPYILALED
jgi:hypothetical protein